LVTSSAAPSTKGRWESRRGVFWTMICLENVSKTYQTGTVALRDLSLDIE
jgi:hypothetical protein